MTSLEAMVVSFLIGAILASLVKSLFKIGLLVGLLVALLVVVGAVSISAPGGSLLSISSIYGLSTSIWSFLSTFASALMRVIASGGISSAIAAVVGFALVWVGGGWLPFRRRD